MTDKKNKVIIVGNTIPPLLSLITLHTNVEVVVPSKEVKTEPKKQLNLFQDWGGYDKLSRTNKRYKSRKNNISKRRKKRK